MSKPRPSRGPSAIIEAYPIPIAALAVLALLMVFAFSFVMTPKAGASNPSELRMAETDYQEFSQPVPLTAEVSSAVMETDSTLEEKPPEPEVAAAPEPVPAPAPPARISSTSQKYTAVSRDQLVTKGKVTATLTFYDCLGQGFCGTMANGRKVHEGAAACSNNMAMGTMFTIAGDPTNRVYICEDRGMLNSSHVDIFWNDPKDGYWWQSQVGMSGTLEIVQLKG